MPDEFDQSLGPDDDEGAGDDGKTDDDGGVGEEQQGGDEAQGAGGHKDMSEQPTAAGALWTRSKHPLIRKALAMLGIKPHGGLIIDVTNEKVRQYIEDLEKKRKTWVLINDPSLHRNQLFLFIDDRGRIFAEPTAKFATGIRPDNSWIQDNPRLSYLPDSAGNYRLITSNMEKWVEYDPLGVNVGQEMVGHACQLIHVSDITANKSVSYREGRDSVPEGTLQVEPAMNDNDANKVGTWYLRREYKEVEFVSGGMHFDLETYMRVCGPEDPMVKYMAGFYMESHMPVTMQQIHKGKEYLLMPLVATPETQNISQLESNDPPLLYNVPQEREIPVKMKTYLSSAQETVYIATQAPPLQTTQEIIAEVILQSTPPELAPEKITIPAPVRRPLVEVRKDDEVKPASVKSRNHKSKEAEISEPKLLMEEKPERPAPDFSSNNTKEEESLEVTVAAEERPVLPPAELTEDMPEALKQSENSIASSRVEEQDKVYNVFMDPDHIRLAAEKVRANAFNGFYSGIETRKLLADLRTKYGSENITGGESIPDDPESPLVLTIREGKYQHVVAELTISRAFTREQGKKVDKSERLVNKYIVKLDPKENPNQTPEQKLNQTEALNRIYDLAAQSRDTLRQIRKKSEKQHRRSVM